MGNGRPRCLLPSRFPLTTYPFPVLPRPLVVVRFIDAAARRRHGLMAGSGEPLPRVGTRAVNSPLDTLKILSDPTRLRLLALLMKEELSVAELQEILGMAQSRISSQLAMLRQAGFVVDRREGKKAFYSLRAGLSPQALGLLRAAGDAAADSPEFMEDRDNLDRVLQKRRRVAEQYFNLIAGRLGRGHCPGRSWEAIGHLALRLVPPIAVADLGAGEGLISQLLARRAERVWCIDNSPRMVEVGTALAKKNGLANLVYKLGDIEDVPLPDRSVDLAILSQALHHAIRPQIAVERGAPHPPPGRAAARPRSEGARVRERPRALRRRLAGVQGERDARLPQEGRLPAGRRRGRVPRVRGAPFRDAPGERSPGRQVTGPARG